MTFPTFLRSIVPATDARREPMPVRIRRAIRIDVPEILEIERASSPQPWREAELLEQLRDRNTYGMVCEHRGRLVGFMVYRLERTCIEVANLAVAPSYRGMTIGHQMVAKLKGKLSEDRRTKLFATVRETDLPRHLFLKACGFHAIRVLHGQFGDEDAYRFRFGLTRGDEP